MIIYEIWKNTKETAEQFNTFEEAKFYGLTHYTEFYIQPKFVITDEEYYNNRKG